MSRIHEALKKAEQERAATQGEVQSSFAAATVAEAPTMGEESPAMAAAVASLAGGAAPYPAMPAFASPFSVDNLLARCAQQQWNPDHGTMLFSNGEDRAQGTEEFRTL